MFFNIVIGKEFPSLRNNNSFLESRQTLICQSFTWEEENSCYNKVYNVSYIVEEILNIKGIRIHYLNIGVLLKKLKNSGILLKFFLPLPEKGRLHLFRSFNFLDFWGRRSD